jgi:hypothetical protein
MIPFLRIMDSTSNQFLAMGTLNLDAISLATSEDKATPIVKGIKSAMT